MKPIAEDWSATIVFRIRSPKATVRSRWSRLVRTTRFEAELKMSRFSADNAARRKSKPSGGLDNLIAVVTTINTPMPLRIDEDTLIACLKGDISEQKWRVYVQAFFDEVDVSAIHRLVIDRLVTFEDLLKAIDHWRVTESDNERWVREMASFAVGTPDEESPDRSR